MKMARYLGAACLAITLGAAFCFGAYGQIISSFKMPVPPYMSGYALAWDGSYLWTCGWGEASACRVNTAGSLIDSFVISGGNPQYHEGAAYDGHYLWIGIRYWSRSFFNRYTTTGSYVSGFDTNLEFAGMTWDGSYLRIGARTYTTNGSFLSSFNWGNTGASDMAWYHGYLWYRGNSGYIYQRRDAGPIVGSFPEPAGNHISGITFDGQYLWAVAYYGWCYKIDVDVVDIEPGSLGRVKSVYR